MAALDDAQMPTMPDLEQWLERVEVLTVSVPHDCRNGFLHAYWGRPAAYLDARIRSGISSFWAISDVDNGLRTLARDLEAGEWERRYAGLVDLDAYDAGYRLVVAN